MTLVKLAIHGLQRLEKSEAVKETDRIRTNYSKTGLSPGNSTSQILYEQLEISFNKSTNPVFASFGTIEELIEDDGQTEVSAPKAKKNPSMFPKKLRKYLEGSKTEFDFITFNHEVLDDLKLLIEPLGGFRGGYFIFTEGRNEADSAIEIFFVGDKRAVNFNWVTDHYDIKDFKSFNTDKLVMSCRIHTDRYLAAPLERCLDFYTVSAQERGFFYNWLVAKETESSKSTTEAVVGILRNNPPRDPDTGNLIDPVTKKALENDNEFDPVKYDEVIIDALGSEPNGIANLPDISKRIYGETVESSEEQLEKFLKQEDMEVPREFKRYEPFLKNMTWIVENAEEISLKFPERYMENKIKLGREKDENGQLQLTGRITIDCMPLAEKINNRTR